MRASSHTSIPGTRRSIDLRRSEPDGSEPGNLDCWRLFNDTFGEPRLFDTGEYVFRQGDGSARVYLVDSGVVKIVRSNAGGLRKIVAVRRAGSFLGLPSIVKGTPYAADAVACVPSEIRSADCCQFNRLRTRSATIGAAVSLALAVETLLQLRAGADAGLPAKIRLWNRLAELGDCGEKAEDGWKKVECCWTQTDFAELVGTTREWTNALLHQLETEGRIRRKEGWVFVRVPTRRVKPL